MRHDSETGLGCDRPTRRVVAGRQLDEPGGLQFSQTLTETILAERELLEQAVIARRDMNDENERHDVVRPAGYIGEFEY